MRIFLLLLFFLFMAALRVHGADPEKVCKEYGNKNIFADICDGDKPKKEMAKSEKWDMKLEDAILELLRVECNIARDFYWSKKDKECKKVPECGSGSYFKYSEEKCSGAKDGYPR